MTADRDALLALSDRLGRALTGRNRDTDRYKRLHWASACVMGQVAALHREEPAETGQMRLI